MAVESEASLTHVRMWSEKGWKRIKPELASKFHPGSDQVSRIIGTEE